MLVAGRKRGDIVQAAGNGDIRATPLDNRPVRFQRRALIAARHDRQDV